MKATVCPCSLNTPRKEVSYYSSVGLEPREVAPAPQSGKGEVQQHPGAARVRERDVGIPPQSDLCSGLPRGLRCLPPAHLCQTQPTCFLQSCNVVRRGGISLIHRIVIKSQRADIFSYSFHQRPEVLSQSINVRTHFT